MQLNIFPESDPRLPRLNTLNHPSAMTSYSVKDWIKKTHGFGFVGTGAPPTDDLTTTTRDSVFSAQLVKQDPPALDAETLLTAKIVGTLWPLNHKTHNTNLANRNTPLRQPRLPQPDHARHHRRLRSPGHHEDRQDVCEQDRDHLCPEAARVGKHAVLVGGGIDQMETP